MTEKSVKDVLAMIEAVVTAKAALEKAAQAVCIWMYDTDALDPAVKKVLCQVRDLDLPWGQASRLQGQIDALKFAGFMEAWPEVFGATSDLKVEGCFDDETGYDPDILTIGPLKFNSAGEYVWERDAVVSLLENDPSAFKAFLSRFGVPEDDGFACYATLESFSGTVAGTLLTDPDALDDAKKIQGIDEICTAHSYPCEGLDSHDDLSTLFYIISGVYRRCASMREEQETVPLAWVQGRLG